MYVQETFPQELYSYASTYFIKENQVLNRDEILSSFFRKCSYTNFHRKDFDLHSFGFFYVISPAFGAISTLGTVWAGALK
jgi:hypothetical protein